MRRLSPNPSISLSKAALGGLLVAAALALAAGPALGQGAADLPWPQFQGGPSHPGVADGPVPPYRRSWSFPIAPVGEHGASAPVIAGDVAIVVGPRAVYGIALSSGDERWSVARAEGPSTTPAVADVKGSPVLVYSEGSSKADARVQAIDLDTRKPAWRAPFTLAEQSHSGVTVDGDTAYVADDAGDVYALDVATGSMRWTAILSGGVQGPLTVSGGTVYAVPQGRLSLSVNASPTVTPAPSPSPSGSVVGDRNRLTLVALSAKTGKAVFGPGGGQLPIGTFFSSLPLASGGVVYVSASDGALNGQLVSLDGTTGTVRWVHRGVGPVWQSSSPTKEGGALFVADARGGVWRLDASTGERVFDFQFNETLRRSSPVVVSGRAVLVGLNDGRLVAVDPATGHERWESVAMPGLVGGLAVSNDVVIAARGGLHGGIEAFAADPSGRLVDVTSPSVASPPRLLGNFAIAAVVVMVLLFVPLGYVSRRAGPPALAGPDDAEPDADDEEEPE